MSGDIVEIDGSILEGGGQILRISAALSAILSFPIKIRNIRAGRSTPGLRPQHLTGLRLIRDLSNGVLRGDEIGSTEIEFRPQLICGGEFAVDTKTAGSITLMLQAALPCLLFAAKPTKLVLKGGTDVDMAPPFDYFNSVFLPTAERFGGEYSCQLIRRGFYPKGQGEVFFQANPVLSLQNVIFDKPQQLKLVDGISFVAGNIPVRVAKEMSETAVGLLKQHYPGIPIKIKHLKETEEKAFGNGAAIVLKGETEEGLIIGGSALGKPKVPAACVAQSATEELLESCKQQVALDQHLQDQTIILMALASGTSRFLVGPLTLHTQTAMHITTMLTKVQFQVVGQKSNPETFVIECQGLGLVNKNMQ